MKITNCMILTTPESCIKLEPGDQFIGNIILTGDDLPAAVGVAATYLTTVTASAADNRGSEPVETPPDA